MPTKTKQTAPSITNAIRITTPIYWACSQDDAKLIIAKLREIAEDQPKEESSTIGSVSVETHTTSQKLIEMEHRLKIDLRTLRQLLFNSLKTGLQVDVAYRLQRELGDTLTIIDDESIQQGFAKSLERYHSYL